MQLQNCPLPNLGIPQDVIDQAKQLGIDAEKLVELCVKHTVDAARDWLMTMVNRLPKK